MRYGPSAARKRHDDRLYALQPSLPQLTRSTLHRCLQRHGLSWLPEMDGDKPVEKRFRNFPLDCFHVPRPAGVCSQTPRGTSPRSAPARASSLACIFGRVCAEHGIERRLTRVSHPRPNGQVERMSRTITHATLERCHSDGHEQLRMHLQLFLDTCSHARRPKTPRGLMRYEFIGRTWFIGQTRTTEPDRFGLGPSHHIPRLCS